MTSKTDGRLTAALLLTRQALRLLEELSAPPRSQPARPTRPGPQAFQPIADAPVLRTPQSWRGQVVPISFDEVAVLWVLDRGSDDDGTYRLGLRALETDCHLGRHRLKAALASLISPLVAPDGPRPALVQALVGPRGRVDHQLLPIASQGDEAGIQDAVEGNAEEC